MIRLVQQNAQEDRHLIDFYPEDCFGFFNKIGAKHDSGDNLFKPEGYEENIDCKYVSGMTELTYSFKNGVHSTLSAEGPPEEITDLEAKLLKFMKQTID
ncbi:MAG: hypothetical protein AABW79_03755 [Nanoarchaeota archaeon]